MFRLIDAVERRPQTAFAAFLVLHAVVWTALPAILYLNLPVDLIEALTYGRNGSSAMTSCRRCRGGGRDRLPGVGVDTPYYALAQAVVVIAFVLVWKTARPLVGALGALVAILIIDGMHYFNFTAAKFNHDVIQLPFWGSLVSPSMPGSGAGDRLLGLAGAALGCALWAKYSSRCSSHRWCCSCSSTGKPGVDWPAPALGSPPPWRSPSWRRTSSGWCRTISCLPLCRGPGPAGARAARSSAASVPVPGRTIFLHPSGAGDRRAALLAAKKRKRAERGRRRLRPPHRHPARVRPGAHGLRAVAHHRPRHGHHVGLSALAVPRALDRHVRAGGA